MDLTEIKGLPQDLSKQFLENILKEELKEDVKILEVGTNAGSTKGDHHLSEINRIHVKYIINNIEKSISFIFKDVTKSPLEFISSIRGTDKECSWYEKILPQIINYGVNIGAKCYKIHKNWLLIEDLCVSGYKILNRIEFLDLNHCIEAMKVLAKFHAVTHHLYENNDLPEIAIKNTQFTSEHKLTMYDNLKSFDKISNNLLEVNGGEKYYKRIKEIKIQAWDRLLNCLKNDGDFKCLVHGDFWTTNMLFNYNKDNEVNDAKVIDFQLLRRSTPTYDLHFFICTSMHPNVRDNHLDEILKVYISTLNSTLEEIGSKNRLSDDKFFKIFEETYFIGLFMSLSFLPVPLCDPESHLELTPPPDATEEEKLNYRPFDKVYKQDKYRKHLMNLLDFYHKKNII